MQDPFIPNLDLIELLLEEKQHFWTISESSQS